MAEEKTVALDCDQYEDFKEEFIKAFKAEIAKLQGGGDNTALMQRIDEIARVQNLSAEQITNFINRIGQIEIKPVVEVQPPDMTDINSAFGKINVSTETRRSDEADKCRGKGCIKRREDQKGSTAVRKPGSGEIQGNVRRSLDAYRQHVRSSIASDSLQLRHQQTVSSGVCMTGSDCRAIRCGKYMAGREQSTIPQE